MKKIRICLLCLLMIFNCICIPVSAANIEVIPYYNNVNTINSSLSISEDGRATVYVFYQGVSGITTGATITSKIQKRSLGLIWTTVDIGTADNVWVDEATGVTYSNSHSVQLKSNGTYRAVVDFVVRGTGGANDEVSQTSTAEY